MAKTHEAIATPTPILDPEVEAIRATAAMGVSPDALLKILSDNFANESGPQERFTLNKLFVHYLVDTIDAFCTDEKFSHKLWFSPDYIDPVYNLFEPMVAKLREDKKFVNFQFSWSVNSLKNEGVLVTDTSPILTSRDHNGYQWEARFYIIHTPGNIKNKDTTDPEYKGKYTIAFEIHEHLPTMRERFKRTNPAPPSK